jgi:hypothetical protein
MSDLDDFFASVDTAVAEAAADEGSSEPSSKKQRTEAPIVAPVVMKTLSKTVVQAALPTAVLPPPAQHQSTTAAGYDMSVLHRSHAGVMADAFVSQQGIYEYKAPTPVQVKEAEEKKRASAASASTTSTTTTAAADKAADKKGGDKKGSASTSSNAANAASATNATNAIRDGPKSNPVVRSAAGKTWVDNSMASWPENDFRLFVGDISKEVTDDILFQAFKKYPSTTRVKIIYDTRTGVTKGYGFVSMLDASDAARAIREMNDVYIGGRPVKVKKSDWKERDSKEVAKKKKMEERRKRQWM